MARIINGGFRPKVGSTIQTSRGPRIVKSRARIDWEKKRDEVLEALADGHPNHEGYMEWWASKNPQPTQ